MANRPISPAEHTKKHPPPIQSNAHPYAIKTTSSALLSRSNSSPHYANYMKHHYVPPPPSRVTAGRVRHRHSSSVSAVEDEAYNEARAVPAPLPTPPPSTLVASTDDPSESLKHVDEPKLTHRVRRAETMPNSATEPREHHSYDQKLKYNDQDSRPAQYAGLPLNPKQWNTDELTTYLEMSLSSGNRSTDTRNDDTTVVDILNYVRTRNLTGRELLRLTDGDFVGTLLSDAQRAQLLERSRTLRTDVFRGRIYVDSYHSQDISDNSKDIHSLSARAASTRGASVSTDDLRLLAENYTSEGSAAFPPSPAMTLHRSNLISEASAQRYRDLARMRMRRRGRVKGLVETWERASTSESECSASEEESVSGSDADPETESILDADNSPERSPDLPSNLQDASIHDVHSLLAHLTGVSQEPPSLTPPPPYTHVCAPRDMVEEEELTVEELLASSSNVPLKGARAWEADFGLGETVKRIPVSLDADTESPRSSSSEPSIAHGSKDGGQRTRVDYVRSRSKRSSVRGSAGRGEKDPRTRNRVVTAIFTGSPSEGVSESTNNEVHLAGNRRRASGANGSVRGEAPATSDLQDGAIRALEESIAATRAQLDAFRVRLEQVETDTARQEAELRRAQCSDAHHTLESKRRRSEASVQTTLETEGLPRDEMLVTDARDVLDIWETISLPDITRAIVAKAMRWLFPYGRPSVRAHGDEGQPLVRTGSPPGVNDKYPIPAGKGGRLALARMSCSIILVSFAICTAVLRRMGFGRWVRRP